MLQYCTCTYSLLPVRVGPNSKISHTTTDRPDSPSHPQTPHPHPHPHSHRRFNPLFPPPVCTANHSIAFTAIAHFLLHPDASPIFPRHPRHYLIPFISIPLRWAFKGCYTGLPPRYFTLFTGRVEHGQACLGVGVDTSLPSLSSVARPGRNDSLTNSDAILLLVTFATHSNPSITSLTSPSPQATYANFFRSSLPPQPLTSIAPPSQKCPSSSKAFDRHLVPLLFVLF